MKYRDVTRTRVWRQTPNVQPIQEKRMKTKERQPAF